MEAEVERRLDATIGLLPGVVRTMKKVLVRVAMAICNEVLENTLSRELAWEASKSTLETLACQQGDISLATRFLWF